MTELPDKDVNFALHSPHRQETFGLEERRAERAGGEVVREGGEKSGEEAEEDGTAGRAGESHHHPERQHEVHHHTEVRGGCTEGPVHSSFKF